MDKKKANVPKLRFPGFTEEWERRKLGELLNFSNGFNGSSELYGRGIRYISVMDILNNDYIVYNNIRGMVDLDEKTAKRYSVEYGDVLFQRSSETAEDAGKSNIYVDKKMAVFGGFVIRGKKMAEYDPYFLKYMLDTDFIRRQLISKAQGAQHINVGQETLKVIDINIPVLTEQNKIGKIFRNIEKLIALHQHKLNHLQAKKKGLLQKMFPKDGGDFPELRFPGFTDAWQRRKLGDIASFSKGQGYSKNDLTDTGMPIILYGRLYTKYQSVIDVVDTFTIERAGSVYSTGNEVIVPASGETAEDISRASAVAKSRVLLGGDLNIVYPDDRINSIFLAISLSNGNQQKELSKRAQGKSVVHLHNSDLQNVELQFPIIKEQMQISSFFKHFDNLITLHKRKLTHLQEQKKALLQQMFV